VSAKGYLEGRTTGNTTVGAAVDTAGGSYGGLGGSGRTGPANAVYGDYANPEDWGSGGGDVGQPNTGTGGGLVRLHAGSLQLDGQLLANGMDDITAGYGGGSGGGVLVSVQTLAGAGRIEARGGHTWGCCNQ